MMQRMALILLWLAAGIARADPAVDVETFYSSDKAGFDTYKQLFGIDFSYRDPEHYLGLAAQYARYSGPDFHAEDNRAYLRYADTHDNGDGTNWKWNGTLGFDEHTWLGSAEVYKEAADGSRDDVFVERDLVETKLGTADQIYYTLLGYAKDFSFTPRFSATGVVAYQDFSGDNARTLLRGRISYVLSEDYGISAQLRTRWFYDSTPNEYDYFSPRWYGEWIPTLAMRRFYGGNQFYAALGYGQQRTSDSGSRSARLAEVGWTSPKRGAWYAKINAGYTDTPLTNAYVYAYRYINAQVVLPF
jgi:hypothetical protein